MTRYLLAFVSVVAFLAAVRAEDPPKPSYESLVAEAKKGNAKVDFARMRIAFSETPAFNPIVIDETTNQMNAAYATMEYEAAVAAAEKVLAKKYVDLSAHKIAADSYAELDKPEKAKFHRTIFDGLIQSILKSGDGKTAATAYVVIATDEEYEVLRRLGIRSQKQALLQEKGEMIDRIEGFDLKTKQPVTVYFNATIPFRAIEKLFQKK